MGLDTNTLSERQLEILRLLGRHYQVKEVAHLLSISEKTVRNHIDEARRRLGGLSMREAVRLIVSQDEDQTLGQNYLYQKTLISEEAGPGSDLDHEHDLKSERQLSDHQFRGTSERLAHVIDTGQGSRSREHDPRTENPERDDTASENHLRSSGGVGLADFGGRGRWIALKRWLRSRRALQWLGLVGAVGVISAFLLISAMTAVMGGLQLFDSLTRHAG